MWLQKREWQRNGRLFVELDLVNDKHLLLEGRERRQVAALRCARLARLVPRQLRLASVATHTEALAVQLRPTVRLVT